MFHQQKHVQIYNRTFCNNELPINFFCHILVINKNYAANQTSFNRSASSNTEKTVAKDLERGKLIRNFLYLNVDD